MTKEATTFCVLTYTYIETSREANERNVENVRFDQKSRPSSSDTLAALKSFRGI